MGVEDAVLEVVEGQHLKRLDAEHNRRVCALLDAMDTQVFITCVDEREVCGAWPDSSSISLFHVEQGRISSRIAAAGA